jgi:hypothetical protein
VSRGSWRTTPLPNGWGRLRASVLIRDPICRWGMLPGEDGPCHMPSTTSDHMGPPDDHRIELLRGLCEPHHVRRSASQGQAAKTARYRAMKFRPKEPHPGFIRDGGLCLQRRSYQSRSTASPARARRHVRPVRGQGRSIRISARPVITPGLCRSPGSRETDPSRPAIKAIHPTREVAQRDEPERKGQKYGLENGSCTCVGA